MQEDLKMAIAVRMVLLPEIFRRLAKNLAKLLEESPQVAESETAALLVDLIVQGDKFCDDEVKYFLKLEIFEPDFERKVIAKLNKALDEFLSERDLTKALERMTPQGLVS